MAPSAIIIGKDENPLLIDVCQQPVPKTMTFLTCLTCYSEYCSVRRVQGEDAERLLLLPLGQGLPVDVHGDSQSQAECTDVSANQM